MTRGERVPENAYRLAIDVRSGKVKAKVFDATVVTGMPLVCQRLSF